MSEWRDIESAPKDGTSVDLWLVWGDTKEGERVTGAWWGEGREPFEDEIGWGWIDPNGGVDGCSARIGDDQLATHWMPLPEPPIAERAGME